ncbi:MAG TPA: HD domain-containing protein [Candidatus Thermoplasmatota archaeon]|nr:HD domain-containing protein [Candidatus Thermoplasmatota archaeon]
MNLADLVLEVVSLKDVDREGWKRVAGAARESVAEHTYGVAALAALLGPDLGVDADRLTRLAVLHDLAEVRTGDITPADGIAPLEKRRREQAALAAMLAPLGPTRAAALEGLAVMDSPEARILKQLDALEMLAQALRQEERGGAAGDLDAFWASGMKKLEHPFLVALGLALEARRP